MVKYIITRESDGTDMAKFTCEFNTYGVGEELLYPIKMNDSSIGQPQPETNLATYLINFYLFQKSNVEIKSSGNKAWYFYFAQNIQTFINLKSFISHGQFFTNKR